jgi:hypothetical protein
MQRAGGGGVIIVVLIVGGVIAYVLFRWMGVAYYLLVIDWIFVSAFVLLLFRGASRSLRFVRDELIPDTRRNRLVNTYNRLGGQPISQLNVHMARVVGFGAITDEVDAPPLPAEATFDGVPLAEVKLLSSRTFYMITTNSSIELWERRKTKFLEMAWFDKAVVESKVESRDSGHTLELRFPEGTFIRLIYGAT